MSEALLAVEETLVERGRVLEDRRVGGCEDCPEWFRMVQEEAWEEFQRLPMPGRKDESWRFAGLKQLDFGEYRYAEPIDEQLAASLVKRSQSLEERSGKLVLANDCVIAMEQPRQAGVEFLSFGEALREHPGLVEKFFMLRKSELGSAKFAALHKAALRSGVFVHVAAGVEVAHPLEVFQWVCGDRATVFPHSLIIAEPGSKVSVVSYHRSGDESEPGLSIGVADLIVGEGAEVNYYNCQKRSATSRNIQMSAASLYRGGKAKNFVLNLGCAWVRDEMVSHLLEDGSSSDMLSVSITNNGQEVDQRTLQHHEAPHTRSDLLFKNALYDNSRTIFAGLIHVDEEAHHTDAYQKCRNLLGSDEAEANAMPGLEINADQVKCSHGATSGEVSEEEMFYLLSRGIPPSTARKLITFGFTREVIERIGHDAIEQVVTAMVEEKFRGIEF